MRFYEIFNESSYEERMQRARDQGFDVDNPHYHGTPAGDFDEFDPYRTADENLAYGKGIYLSRDPDAASGYSNPGSSWGNDNDESNPTVYKVFHRVKNPFDMNKAYPFAEVKRIFEYCFTPKQLAHLEIWQEVLKDVGYANESNSDEYSEPSELEELEIALYHIDSGDFEGAPDPEDYEDGDTDVDYIKDLEDAIAYENKHIQQRIDRIKKREEEEYAKKQQMIADGRLGSVMGRDIYRTLWTNTDGYHNWKAESQLFGGETEDFDFKSEANDWLQELGYDGLTHVDSYNPGNRGKPHSVTIAFKPEQVRSVHAEFHPDKKDSPKMSESLNEMTRPESRVSADMVLRKAGYTRLGKGEHGAVYAKPGKKYILKVFSSKDAAYLDFIHLSQRHQDNPHFPKFYGKVVQVTPKYCAVRTERLIPAWIKVDFVRNYLLYSKGDPDNAFIARVLADMEKYPKLKECCDLIIDEHFPKFDPDPCDENIMMRDDTIVITDPTVVYGLSPEDTEVLPDDDGKAIVPEKPYGKKDDELLQKLGV